MPWQILGGEKRIEALSDRSMGRRKSIYFEEFSCFVRALTATPQCSGGVYKFTVEPGHKVVSLQSDSDEELPEESVDGTHFVKPHLVDDPLEDKRVISEQVDAPFPNRQRRSIW